MTLLSQLSYILHEDFSCCIGRNQETWTCGKLNTRNPCVLPHNRFSEPLQLPCCLTFHSWRKAELNNYLRIFSLALLPYELFLQLVVIYTLTITGKTQLSVIFYRTGLIRYLYALPVQTVLFDRQDCFCGECRTRTYTALLALNLGFQDQCLTS